MLFNVKLCNLSRLFILLSWCHTRHVSPRSEAYHLQGTLRTLKVTFCLLLWNNIHKLFIIEVVLQKFDGNTFQGE